MEYNWQHPDWPNFEFDEAQFKDNLYQYAIDAGRLSGGIGQMQAALQYEAYVDLMVSEAINTSKIEGERLDRQDVRSSIKNYLGLSVPLVRVADPRAEGIAALMVDVRKTFNQPLTKEKLFQWQQLAVGASASSLYKPDIALGQWRTAKEPMQIVSGPIGYEKVHYQAPPADEVGQQIGQLLNWYNQSNPLDASTQKPKIPGPVRAAIVHLWFESIHPFEDGNGRVGRAIAEQALAQDLGHPPILSLSTEIEKDRNGYYNGLGLASKANMNITEWVNWFTAMVLRAQQDAALSVDFILKKAKFWTYHQNSLMNERQTKVIRKLFEAGPHGFEFGVSAKKYMSMTRCSKATATRDLGDLVGKRCLNRLEGGGRNVRYGLDLSD
jgi:Fic family protein